MHRVVWHWVVSGNICFGVLGFAGMANACYFTVDISMMNDHYTAISESVLVAYILDAL